MELVHWIESFVRVFMCLLGILGNNWLVIRSLPGPSSLLRTNEVLLINLAASNLITNYLVDLPDTIADFAGYWFLGETYCRMFSFLANLSETSSIFSTFFISVFWHQKLVGSLKRGGAPVQLDNLRLVAGLLAGSWAVSVLFSSPNIFFVTVMGTNGSQLECVNSFPSRVAKQTYMAVYLTLANALPLAGIIVFSIQIVVTLLGNQKRIQGHASHADTGAAEKEKANITKMSDEMSTKTADDQVYIGPSGNYQQDDPNQPGTPSMKKGQVGSGSPLHSTVNGPNRAPPEPSKSTQAVPKPSPGSGTQVRAAKSVVAVATVFLVCWLTHFLLDITSDIHPSELLVEIASYIAASYTCIIPYIFLYGLKKLSCSCRKRM
ncbi:rhodopsin [Aplochiton taeniatus]